MFFFAGDATDVQYVCSTPYLIQNLINKKENYQLLLRFFLSSF